MKKKLNFKKLVINKETLRTLTDSDLQRIQGGGVRLTAASCDSAWCSSTGYATGPGKCGTNVVTK